MRFEVRLPRGWRYVAVLVLLGAVLLLNARGTKVLLGNFRWSEEAANFWHVLLLSVVPISLIAVRFPIVRWPASLLLMMLETAALFRFLMLVSPNISQYGSGPANVATTAFTVVGCVMARYFVTNDGRDTLILSIGMVLAVAVLRYQYIPTI